VNEIFWLCQTRGRDCIPYPKRRETLLYTYDSTYYLWQRLAQLENEIARLKKENEELKEKIDNLKPLHIEKIEYKIHELHVENLSGTLNIGLTANGEETGVGDIIEQVVEEHRTNLIGEKQPSKQDNATEGENDSPNP
jgi:hypothetical protein